MKTKNGDNSINTITIKKKLVANISQLFVKKAKKTVRTKHKFAKSKPHGNVKLFGRALVFAMTIPLMVCAYIYIEGTAQAETHLSAMQIVYKFYNANDSQNKIQIIFISRVRLRLKLRKLISHQCRLFMTFIMPRLLIIKCKL